jgi:hypothetical protein
MTGGLPDYWEMAECNPDASRIAGLAFRFLAQKHERRGSFAAAAPSGVSKVPTGSQ